jgi:hypothetical protein
LSLQEAISKVNSDFRIQTEDNYCLKPTEISKENSDPAKVAHGLTLGYGKCGFIIQSSRNQFINNPTSSRTDSAKNQSSAKFNQDLQTSSNSKN